MVALSVLVAATACAAGARRREQSSPDASSTAIVRGIDHFFATSSAPEPLYRIFRDTFGLPEVYPFRAYEGFSSGVVSMGDVLFEVATWEVPADSILPTELKGIAFAPSDRLPITLTRLRDHGFAYQAPDSVMYTTSEGTRALGYVNVPLDGPAGLPPTNASIFIYDDLASARAASRRREGAEELARRNGGPLGVLAVQELVIGVEQREAALAQWRRLLESSTQESGGVITFPNGPALRFVEAPSGAILEMVVRVRSLEVAERFLAGQGMLRKDEGQVLIALPSAGALRIRLVE